MSADAGRSYNGLGNLCASWVHAEIAVIVIPAKSLSRTPIRGRNPEGGEVRPTPLGETTEIAVIVIPAKSLSRTPIRGRNPEGGEVRPTPSARPPTGSHPPPPPPPSQNPCPKLSRWTHFLSQIAVPQCRHAPGLSQFTRITPGKIPNRPRPGPPPAPRVSQLVVPVPYSVVSSHPYPVYPVHPCHQSPNPQITVQTAARRVQFERHPYPRAPEQVPKPRKKSQTGVGRVPS